MRWRDVAYRMHWLDPWLVLAVAVAAWLRVTRLGDFDNAYYTATVASMLTSPRNFIYASFDPLGVVTVDKPPVAMWVQAVPAAIFGVSRTTVVVPQVVLGTLAIVLLYATVRPAFGRAAAAAAALTLAVLPASVVIDSGNEPDALLSFVLLLAAFAVVRAARTGRWAWLLTFAVLMGVAFNIKMLVAFVPLPAFTLYYSLASKASARRVALKAAAALAVVTLVSLSWVTLVALTPSSERPYVGSTRDNSIWTLVFKYNGLDRFTSFGLRTAQQPPPQQVPSPQQPPPGTQPVVPQQQTTATYTGVFGLFRNPLAGQMGWLLPLALVALMATLTLALPEDVFRRPLSWPAHMRDSPAAAEAILWGGWLLTAIVVFGLADATTSHPYYLVGVAAPLAAVLGIGMACLWRAFRGGTRLAWLAPPVAAGGVLYQAFHARNMVADWAVAAALLGAFLAVLVMLAAIWRRLTDTPLASAAIAVGGLAALVAPLVFATSLGGPKAGPQAGLPGQPVQQPSPERQRLLYVIRYLKERAGEDVVIATLNAREAAPFILEGLHAVAVGGFSGNDPILTPESLRRLAEGRGLRYYLMTSSVPQVGPVGARPPNGVLLDYIRRSWEDVSPEAGVPYGTLYRYRGS